MIAILDYGIGNVSSISNMLNKLGVPNEITSDPKFIETADKIILPGVGHFDYCMKQLRDAPFFHLLNNLVLNNNKPILGVCVGCQMLMENSEEGKEKGLGWLKGKVIKFDLQKMPSDFKIPHMSWSDVLPKNNDLLYRDINNPRFYFVHSYYVICENDRQVSATAEYGYEFTASVHSDNIFGVQFHPEKSHLYGMKLYANFCKI
jgi:glutamine amidotransferase